MQTRILSRILAPMMLLGANVAGAVSLSASGMGQVLIYPYYTVNKGQDTLISVVNASDVGKILEVDFVEGYNGREVLKFILLLSAHDVWTAAISQTADDGGATMRTSDKSCTDPLIPTDGVAFRSGAYDGTGPVPADEGPQGITRTREGFIEIFTLGDIPPGSATETAITHVQNGTPGAGVPPGCATLNANTYYSEGITPTTGLFGSGSIVNVGQGTFFAYNADALADFTDVPLLSPDASVHHFMQDANSAEAVNGVATSYTYDAQGRPIATDWAFGIDAVSAALMAETIQNEYLTSASLGANTDWVVTFPTKQFYVDDLYGSVPFPPFVEAFHAPGISTVTMVATHFDREEGSEQQPPACDQTGCMAYPPLTLGYQVNVLSYVEGSNLTFTIGTPSRVLGSVLTYSALDPFGEQGFTTADLTVGDGGHILPGGVDSDGNDVLAFGLPTVGFMVYNIINAHAQPGMLANYGGAFAHRSTTCIDNGNACGEFGVGAAAAIGR